MNSDLNKLLIIDQEIANFYYDNMELNDEKFIKKFNKEKYVDKIIKIIEKLSNKNILELLKRSSYIKDIIDLKKYLKNYPINKTYLKKNQDMYILEYKKLCNTCDYLSDISKNSNEFLEYMDILNIDGTTDYLLSNMPNDQIYKLASETGEWDLKLYYFSYLKK